MKMLLSAICLCIATLVCAQKDLPVSKKKIKKPRPAPQWDTLYYKNEFSLDISPAVAFVAGAINNRESFGFTYRRFLSKRDAIRVGTRHGVYIYSYRYGDVYGPSLSPDTMRTFGVGDTIAYSRYYQTDVYSPDIRIGYEHRFGKRRFKLMLGADAIIGLEKVNTIDDESYFVVDTYNDSTGTVYYWQRLGGPVFPYRQPSRHLYLKVGVSPFVGVQVHLSKRFSLNASFLMDIAWNVPLKGERTNEGISLNAYAPAADIGLTVHF